MKSFLKFCWRATRRGTAGTWAVATWSLWLLLGALFAGQLWWLLSKQLAVPGFALRALEKRLEASQLHATFGRTVFDPSGRILIENLRLSSKAFSDPLATAGIVYVRIDPWSLLAGHFEPLEVQLSGVNLYVPAMLSASGRPEPVISDLDTTIVPGSRQLDVLQFNARAGALLVTARGAVPIAAWGTRGDTSLPIADFISRSFPALSREAADILARLNILKDPELHLDLAPAENGGVRMDAQFRARSLGLEQPLAAKATELFATTKLTFEGNSVSATRIDAQAATVSLPRGTVMEDVAIQVRGSGRLRSGQREIDAQEADIAAARVETSAFGAPIAALSMHLVPPHGGPLRGSFAALLGDAPLFVSGETDIPKKTASLHLDGRVTPTLLDALVAASNPVLRTIVTLTSPARFTGEARLGSGWTFESLDARGEASGASIRSVPIDSVSGRITLAGTALEATEIVLHQGENVARGSYLTDTATKDYRFLVSGNLRPLDIKGWFGPWWPNLFSHFDFSAAPPAADADVQGRWGSTPLTKVYVRVDAISPAINGVRFDRARTMLFIRQDFVDAREFVASRGPGQVRGTFARSQNSAAGALRELDFSGTSNLDLQEFAPILGENAAPILDPYRFAQPPALKISGHIEGPGSAGGPHQKLHIEGDAPGVLQLFGFPLSNTRFTVEVNDDDISLGRAEADFAGGRGSGKVHLWGRGDEQRVSFDYEIKDANLGRAVTTIREFAAMRKKAPVPAKTAFIEKAADMHLDLKAAAEGKVRDLLSFRGSGEADLSGPEIGQVRLLSGLTEWFTVASLRFTKMHTPIKIEGPQLVFADLKLTGANSGIDASGTYAMDRDRLDFKARVRPFKESKGFFQKALDFVTSPLSDILEVNLTGPLESPDWVFVAGPTNLVRTLFGGPSEETSPTATPAPDSTPSPPAAVPPAPSPSPSP